MDRRHETIQLVLTREEVQELFSRCLRSLEEDNATSAVLLKKIAQAIEEGDTELKAS